jgi:uncharacterized protein (DUF302 family)
MNQTSDVKFGRVVETALSYGDAIERVRELLKEQGFGVLCEIDVAQTLREKSGVSFRPYMILGACKPQLAHRALSEEAQLGLLLPCNVVVQEVNSRTVVSAVDAQAMLGVVGNSALTPIADEANAALALVLDGITKAS